MKTDFNPSHYRFQREQSVWSRQFCEWDRGAAGPLLWARDFATGVAFIFAIWGTWFLTAHLAHWCNVLGACSQ